MHADYGNLGAFLSWMALFFTDDARQDLLRLNTSFCIFPLALFGWGGAGVGVVVGFCGLGGG